VTFSIANCCAINGISPSKPGKNAEVPSSYLAVERVEALVKGQDIGKADLGEWPIARDRKANDEKDAPLHGSGRECPEP
jgi:hypothetical protein